MRRTASRKNSRRFEMGTVLREKVYIRKNQKKTILYFEIVQKSSESSHFMNLSSLEPVEK